MDQTVRARDEERGRRTGAGDKASSFDRDAEPAGGSGLRSRAPDSDNLPARPSGH
jgi:hypothetical protein